MSRIASLSLAILGLGTTIGCDNDPTKHLRTAGSDRQAQVDRFSVLAGFIEDYKSSYGKYPDPTLGLVAELSRLTLKPGFSTRPDGTECIHDLYQQEVRYETNARGYRLVSGGANKRIENGEGDDIVYEVQDGKVRAE